LNPAAVSALSEKHLAEIKKSLVNAAIGGLVRLSASAFFAAGRSYYSGRSMVGALARMENSVTYRWILTSQDIVANRVPRYLIPAIDTAFQVGPIKSNKYYIAIFATVRDADSFPNDKVPDVHKEMADGILAALAKP
jgi:hypothetical protein